MRENMETFAQRLKDLRLERELSQNALAKELKISQAAIARWEAGLQIPNIDSAVLLARFFKVTTDYLLGLEN